MMLLACAGAVETMPSNGPQFSPCVWKVFPYTKGITEEYATRRSPRQIETYSLAIVRRASNAISQRNKIETCGKLLLKKVFL